MINNYLFAIIVYNCKVEETLAYQSLKNYDLLIFDNSDKEEFFFCNESFCKKQNLIYLTKHQNLGNSKAYNLIFDYVNQNTKFKWLILADDDTKFSNQYLNELNHLNENIDFYMPYIYSKQQKQIVFPRFYYQNQVSHSYFPNLQLDLIETINSGLILNQTVFSQFYYDEQFFVYCSDFVFVKQLFNAKLKFAMINAKIEQDFFDHSNEFTKTTVKQMDIFLADKAKEINKYQFIKFKYGYIFDKYKLFKKKEILKLIFKHYK